MLNKPVQKDVTINTLSSTLTSINTISFDQASAEDIIKLLVENALESKASDIHIIPSDTCSIKYRMGSALREVGILPFSFYRKILFLIKSLSNSNGLDHLRRQNGNMCLKLGPEDVNLEVSTIPSKEGEECILRILGHGGRELGLENIGLSESEMKIVKKVCEKSNGLVLICGAGGSGKTTMAYAIIKYLKSLDLEISTVENRILYSILGVDQNEGADYENLLKDTLKTHSDVIFIDGVERNIIDLIEKAVMLDHLVIITIDLEEDEKVVSKLREIGFGDFFLKKALRLVISQQLQVKKCEKCYGRGCTACFDTGYSGQFAVFKLTEKVS